VKKKARNIKQQLSKSQIDKVISLYASGQIEEAINEIRLLNNDYPNVPILFNILGACYKELGQLESAKKMFKIAFKIKPDYSEAYFNYAVILGATGQVQEAIVEYKNAVAISPNYPNAHNNLGNAYKEIGMIKSAIDSYEWAIAYEPEFIEALNNLGIALNDLNKTDLAIKNFEKVISIDANNVESHFNLAIVYLGLGKKNKSLDLLKRVIELKPDHVDAYKSISGIKFFNQKDILISKMEALYFSDKLTSSASTKLAFTLSKVYEDLGDYDKQFKFLNEGNNKRKKELNYSFTQSLNLHNRIKKIFNSNFPVIKKSSYDNSYIQLIFIVGLPRSGTSLVEQILASHNKVFGAGELRVLPEILNKILNTNDESTCLSKENILLIRNQYFSRISSMDFSKKIIIDKMPSNFRYIGFISLAFPEAKIINLNRDAKATCWSMYKYYFDSSGLGFSYNQTDLVSYFKLYDELMRFWRDLFPNKIYDICYEDLTLNQEIETRNLLKYCGLDWDQNCLNFHQNKRVVKTTSGMQVRKKIYQGSSEAWKKYEKYLKTLIKGLELF
jgi:Tfp pilus assembly protein PilF